MTLFHSAKIQLSRLTGLVVVALFLLSRVASATPVQFVSGNSPSIKTAHIERHGDNIYVGGMVNRPSFPGPGARVSVQGWDKNNCRVFSKADSVLFTGKPSLVHTASYLVSVSPAQMEKATTIYVTFDNFPATQIP